MTGQVRGVLGAWSLAVLSLPGCLSSFNPIPEPPLECRKSCEEVAACCKQKVYVVLINGADPLGCGNFKGVRDYLNQLGFVKSYYAQIYHESTMLDELKALRKEQPDARIALVGFEYGANSAESLADKAAADGVGVDLIVYLQPKGISSDSHAPAERIVTIEAGDQNAPLPAEGNVVRVACATRYGVPTNSMTLQVLAQELTNLAMAIPLPPTLSEPFPATTDDPPLTPRPLDARGPNPSNSKDATPVSRSVLPPIPDSMQKIQLP